MATLEDDRAELEDHVALVVAQRVRRRACNQEVAGSTRDQGTVV